MTRGHMPIAGDRYRLPSGRIVRVVEPGAKGIVCECTDTGAVVCFAASFLIEQAWRLA